MRQGSLWNVSLSLVGERTGGIMRKQRLFLLLFVTILLLAVCGGKENQVTEEQNVEIETQTVLEALEDISEEKETETVTGQPEETQESTGPEESATAEDDKEKDNSSEGQTSSATEKEQDSQNQSNAQNEPSKPQTTEPDTKPEPEPQQPSQPEPVSYSPQRVVQLATEKTKAAGKIYIPDDLDRMLAEGTITQEDYNDCYPTDGAGYLEFYVATDLNEARDVSGTVKFNSEDDIAANIAGMYSSLPQQYFYMEYHGTVMYGDKECYVFYCYRA